MAQQYSLKEVASSGDGFNGNPTWIIIKDIVYDVTNYMDDHPGGPELVSEWAGRDATKGFDDFGHSNDAKKLLKPLRIGELIEEDKSVNRKKKAAAAKTITSEKAPVNKNKTKRFSWIFC